MNYGYSQHVYRPVMRNPRLFHQNTLHPTSTYYPAQQAAMSMINPPSPTTSYTAQSPCNIRSQVPSLQHSYPNYINYLNLPRFPVPSSLPFSQYSMPTFSYVPTASSKGLNIILIAILVLVALDLVIVRPQKSRFEVRYLKSPDLLH